MAHFAELDEQGRVTRVVVVANAAIAGNEELRGIELLSSLYGHARWKQTSYNGTFRKRFAAAGMAYDIARDAFIRPKPYPSWTLDEATCAWIPPAPPPANGPHEWNEASQAWVSVSRQPQSL